MSDGTTFLCPPAQLHALGPVRHGQFPPAYLAAIEAQRQAARNTMQLARLATMGASDLAVLTARTSFVAAQTQLQTLKIGPPLLNRLVLVARLRGKLVKLVFDVAGATRVGVEQETATLVRALQPLVPTWGQRSAPVRTLVGCPQCQAKLRVTKPGIVRCPRCQANVRVHAASFSNASGEP